ncbi:MULTISPECIES: protein arginine kinase [Caloramator]|uniref:Protein-arginine kinase n=1 Tax=Caloramator australicus RC3 TaxID=857293 RepID=G0V3Y0_9CLOT|nr:MULTISPECIES: protein arginine kinase [Caloramator]MDO6354658.1 protein arginine kinase [Caloramator sp. CAR-1]CCC57820.1 Putative ATP:guanido phosphotransferase YacI [Caloramator australicus RC3]
MLFKNHGSDIVLTSRIRLARNIDGVPFPQKLNQDEANKVIKDVADSVLNSNSAIAHEFRLIKLRELKPLERLSMVEKHLISMDIVNEYQRGAVLLNREENVSIMINEEDHIRLQVIYPGFKVKDAYDYANKLDDLIEEKVQYAYDAKLGYLTSCPTNVGTGIRASVMLHLPALTLTKNINNVFNTVVQVGMTMRGIYGEGSNAMGNIYQISNQVTLGLTEDEIINNLIAVTKKIIDQEIKTREMLFEKQAAEIEDDIYRSLGLLKYSRMLSTQECLNLMSKVRLGIEMGIIKDIDVKKLNDLLVNVQPATLQLIEGRDLDTKERDIIRAKIVRETLR